jgi:FolB domain-containing protein
MNDLLAISNIEFWTRLGVTAAERMVEQRVLISISLRTDTRKTARRDGIRSGIDYERIVEGIRNLAMVERKTLERFAEDIASVILKKFRPASVTVSVTKFPFPGAAGVSMTITRPPPEAGPR